MFAVQIGLPKSIRIAECDTEPCLNLHEDELYEEMTSLPPARPMTETTVVTFQLVKREIMRAYGLVVEHLHILERRPYEEVMALDAMLISTRNLIPPQFQMCQMEEMKTDPPASIMERFLLHIMYHKAVCILHRKYWNSAPVGRPKSLIKG